MNNYEFEADIYTEGIFDAEMTAGGASTASDYEVLNNKPKINGVILVGNKTSEELGIISETDVANLVEAEATVRENADKALSDRIDNLALTGSAEGSSIQITDAANNCGLYSLYIEGKSVQNGIPSPDNPIEIDSIGDSGSLTITTDNGNGLSTSATITSALPLCSVGDVKDELIFNADGTAKIIKRTYLVDNLTLGSALANCNVYSAISPYELVNSGKCTHSNVCIYSGEDKEHFFTYSTAIRVYLPKEYNITASDIKVLAVLKEPYEINLTAEETNAMLGLQTYSELTSIFNSDNAQMSVKYWRNEDVGSLLTSIIRSTNSRLTALENTLIGG